MRACAGLAAALMLAACSGAPMLSKGDRAPTAGDPRVVEAGEGQALDLGALVPQGPLMLVFLRGFS